MHPSRAVSHSTPFYCSNTCRSKGRVCHSTQSSLETPGRTGFHTIRIHWTATAHDPGWEVEPRLQDRTRTCRCMTLRTSPGSDRPNFSIVYNTQETESIGNYDKTSSGVYWGGGGGVRPCLLAIKNFDIEGYIDEYTVASPRGNGWVRTPHLCSDPSWD